MANKCKVCGKAIIDGWTVCREHYRDIKTEERIKEKKGFWGEMLR